MNEDVMRTRRLSLRRRRHLLRNRPDEPREHARDRGGDLRFGLPPRHETPEAAGQPQFGLPGDVTHDLGYPPLPIRMLAPDARLPLIRPRRLCEQMARVRIARLRDRPTTNLG